MNTISNQALRDLFALLPILDKGKNTIKRLLAHWYETHTVEGNTFYVAATHPTLTRPIKFGLTIRDAIEYAIEIKTAGYENVEIKADEF